MKRSFGSDKVRRGGSDKLKLLYNGRVVSLEVLEFDGRVREVVKHPGSVSILPVDGDKVYLLKQYRYPLDDWIWEIPAGTLEEGESPEECALRELEEETGFRAGRLEEMFEAYLVPGYGTERMAFFLATELERGEMHPEPSEKIEVHEMTLEDALTMVKNNEIVDVKTIAALLWYGGAR